MVHSGWFGYEIGYTLVIIKYTKLRGPKAQQLWPIVNNERFGWVWNWVGYCCHHLHCVVNQTKCLESHYLISNLNFFLDVESVMSIHHFFTPKIISPFPPIWGHLGEWGRDVCEETFSVEMDWGCLLRG